MMGPNELERGGEVLDNDSAAKRVTVLLASDFPGDSASLRRIFGHTNWELLCARNPEEAEVVLNRRQIPVILTVPSWSGGRSWRDMLAFAPAGRPARVIVTSSRVDDHLWAEVLNLGGYDMLVRPFDREEVVRIVSLAWLSWRDEAAVVRRTDSRPLTGTAREQDFWRRNHERARTS